MTVSVRHYWVKDATISGDWLPATRVLDGHGDVTWYIAGSGAEGQLWVDVIGPEIHEPADNYEAALGDN